MTIHVLSPTPAASHPFAQPSSGGRRKFIKTGLALGGAMAFGRPFTAHGDEQTINWLTWAGHSDPAIVEPFEKATGIKVRSKEYGSGDLGMVEMLQNPGLYDVVTTSMEFMPQYVQAGVVEEMDPEEYPGWKEYFPEFRQDIGYNVDGKYYTILYEFGYNALAYRNDFLTADDVTSWDIIKDERLRGKVGTQDFWGSAMGGFSIMAGYSPANGRNPYVISNEEFAHLQSEMASIRGQMAGFFEVAGIFSAFANGTIWLQPAGGDWAVQLLRDENVPMATSIPKEGGYLWGEGISIAAGTQKREAAKKFVDYCLSAEAQARFATKGSYSATVPNRRAWEIMQRDMAKWAERLGMDKFDGPNAISAWRDGLIAVRVVPQNQTVEEWAEAWQKFKSLPA